MLLRRRLGRFSRAPQHRTEVKTLRSAAVAVHAEAQWLTARILLLGPDEGSYKKIS